MTSPALYGAEERSDVAANRRWASAMRACVLRRDDVTGEDRESWEDWVMASKWIATGALLAGLLMCAGSPRTAEANGYIYIGPGGWGVGSVNRGGYGYDRGYSGRSHHHHHHHHGGHGHGGYGYGGYGYARPQVQVYAVPVYGGYGYGRPGCGW